MKTHLSVKTFVSIFVIAVTAISAAQSQQPVPAQAFRGTYQIYDLPPGMDNVNPSGINNNGAICGFFFDSAQSKNLGFIDDSGVITRLQVPESTQTIALKLNDSQQAVGYYYDFNNVEHGFLWSAGAFTTIDYPGAMLTIPRGINNSGVIVGLYQMPNYQEHGFIRMPDGTLTTFDDPDLVGDAPEDINDKGHIIGTFYTYADGKFQHKWDNRYFEPQKRGMNNKDQYVGNGYFTDFGGLGGYLQKDKDFFLVAPPSANEVIAADINDSGVIVGWFLSYATGSHGFIAYPD